SRITSIGAEDLSQREEVVARVERRLPGHAVIERAREADGVTETAKRAREREATPRDVRIVVACGEARTGSLTVVRCRCNDSAGRPGRRTARCRVIRERGADLDATRRSRREVGPAD